MCECISFQSSTLHCPHPLSIQNVAFFCGSVFGVGLFSPYVDFFLRLQFSFFLAHFVTLPQKFPFLRMQAKSDRHRSNFVYLQHVVDTFDDAYFFSMPFFWRSKGEEQGGNLLAAFKHTFDWELPIERVLSAKTCRRGYKKDGYPILENRHVLLIGW